MLGADNALYSADFRATERLGALLFQVAGRAGRAELPGEVIVQTGFPEHPLYQALLRHDYDGLAAALLDERRVAGLPPFAHLALLAAEAPQRATVDASSPPRSRRGIAHPARPAGSRSRSSRRCRRRSRAAPGRSAGRCWCAATSAAALQRFLAAWREAIDALPGAPRALGARRRSGGLRLTAVARRTL